MDKTELFNNFDEPICAFSNENKIVFKNKKFLNTFTDFKSTEKFKKHFNFNLIILTAENFENKTPIDFLLKSKENFHTVCTYQNKNDEYIYYYIYSFKYEDLTFAVFKDITSSYRLNTLEKDYSSLKSTHEEMKKNTEKFEKSKELAQAQVLKMGIINRISLVIRETNDIETILSSALKEIHNHLGSFKTYFSIKDKNNFIIHSSVTEEASLNQVTDYEKEVLDSINNKNITVNACLREYLGAPELMTKGVKRIIIPVHDKNKLLGIIVTFTKQSFNEKENREILQSIAVQLASSIIQADLIQELDKKNKKLGKTLTELKDTQMQLINTEKMVSIGQLAAGVAHEINTPLASINSNNGMISRILNSNEPISEERLAILKELNSIDIVAAKRISDIVKSLKRFIRLDEAELQEANINNEIDITLKLIDHEVNKNTVIIKNYAELPPVKCHVNMINQVFMNLLVNACHSIQTTKKDGRIEITTSIKNKNLVVKIKDNGCGISQENKQKIFSAGFTTKKAGIGTGLGLSISKKIIEIHKGTINFTSKENEGSEFIVSIPVN